MIGEDAISFKKKCMEEDIPIVKITDLELDAIATLDSRKKEITGNDATTDEFWNVLFANTARVLEEEKRNALDLDSYSSQQVVVVQRLRNAGFEPAQINGLDSLIKADYTYDEIVEYFNCTMSVKDITDFAVRLAQIKQSGYMKNGG